MLVTINDRFKSFRIKNNQVINELKLKQMKQTPSCVDCNQSVNIQQRFECLKNVAETIEQQIIDKLKELNRVHRQEIDFLMKLSPVEDLDRFDVYFRQETNHIESVVYKCVGDMMKLNGKETKELVEMLEEMDKEEEKMMVKIKRRRRESIWCRFKTTVTKLFNFKDCL